DYFCSSFTNSGTYIF
nr:immunoglobulin light chain junction region [Macaca mulatta]MOX43320.1 immunoglobulin light chain junction region [Macaca mulatta]MOX47356.1 immunoglobulin light chain junction region [Macaca mulatta]